ncbi:PREDICTED: histone-lysine N-methyltransferase SETMAR-like [Dufourea novaeangliae]|uniref:histone-lysine N-methyltransferase SETMAR-like n=1 Tax=Dufourea novaeangliae TaxID=178035 RepID=UPI000766EDDE|nr:PREDICTED: histone-lysine N-methyltransferase SETMAR-like [Dufourea novaeangliae]
MTPHHNTTPGVIVLGWQERKKAAEAHKEICEVYGVDCITDRTCQNWFKKFRSGDFSLKDDQRSGRPTEVDDDQIKAIIEEDRHITVREIAERLNVSHTTIENHLKCLGVAKKLDIWVLHILKEIHLTQRINICDMHLKRNEADPFLKRIITGNEKWVMYSNIIRKRSWSKRDEPAQSTSKAELHQKKVMLSIWWDYKGVVYFELLPRNQTINSDVYCQQLLKLDEAIKEKRPELANRKGIVFHHDNARPHTSLVTRGKLLELGWEVMSHPPYSPDMAPSDYHLFRSLQNSLNGKTFTNDDDRINHQILFVQAYVVLEIF